MHLVDWENFVRRIEFELSGGEEGLVDGEEPAVDVDEDDSMTIGNEVVQRS